MAKPRWMDLNTRMIITIGLVSAIIVLGLVIPLCKAGLAVLENSLAEERIVNVDYPVVEVIKAEQMKIGAQGTYSWVDKDKNRVQIPIDRAIEIYVQKESVN